MKADRCRSARDAGARAVGWPGTQWHVSDRQRAGVVVPAIHPLGTGGEDDGAGPCEAAPKLPRKAAGLRQWLAVRPTFQRCGPRGLDIWCSQATERESSRSRVDYPSAGLAAGKSRRPLGRQQRCQPHQPHWLSWRNLHLSRMRSKTPARTEVRRTAPNV